MAVYYLTITEASKLFGELRDPLTKQFREFPGPDPQHVWIPVFEQETDPDRPEHYILATR